MILWKNYENNEKNIWGYALVYKGFNAFLHKHKEAETYYFIYGIGKLYIDGYIYIIKSPKIVYIPGNMYHAMTPISDYVLLLYNFNNCCKFENINYHYLSSKL